MRILWILILSVLSSIALGQYTYFNNHFNPPEFEQGNSGGHTNLIIKGDSIIACGLYYANNDFQNNFMILNHNGEIIDNIEENIPHEGQDYFSFDESINKTSNNGFIWGTDLVDTITNRHRPQVIRFNEQFERIWSRSLDTQFLEEPYSVAGYLFGRELNNGEILCSGFRIFNASQIDENNFGRLLISKYSANGDSIYEKQVTLWENGVVGSKKFIWPYELFEQPNGDLILSGYWAFDIDPFFMRLSAEGDYISQFTWGTERNEFLPQAVQREDGKIMFAYGHCTESYNGQESSPVNDIRVGLFDPEIMDTIWTRSYGYNYVQNYVHDMERTPDGGYIILCSTPWPEYQGLNLEAGAWILKIDSEGNEEFFKHIPPATAVNTNNTGLFCWGIEVTSDGGFAGVGYYHPEGFLWNTSWVWKTDACGDLVYNNCALSTEETNLPNFDMWPNPANTSFHVQSDEIVESLCVKDLSGRVVLSKNPRSTSFLIDISTLSSSIYLVDVHLEQDKPERVRSMKLIVQN